MDVLAVDCFGGVSYLVLSAFGYKEMISASIHQFRASERSR